MSSDTISSSKRVKPGSDYAARVATKLYGIDAAAVAVDGYADPSFILSTDDEPSYVLKITDRENEQLARLQNAMLAHLSGRSLPVAVPLLVADAQGRGLSFSTDEAGNECCLQLLTYLPGEFAADLPAARPALLRSIGRGLGTLNRALIGFSHPGAARLHQWHVQKAPEVCEAAPLARELRPMVERSLEGFERRVVPALARLRRSVIHGDANDHNLLVSARPGRGLQASGLIDFGDAAEAPTVFEVAIAMAYFMMRQPRPVLAAQELLAAYHSEMPLLPEEIELLYDLVCARLCMTISHAARARHSAPDNAYLLRSEKGAIELLRELHETEHLFFTASMRDACRLSAWPQGEKLSDWLSQQSPSPLLPSLHEGAPRILDFTPGSEDLGGGIAPKSLREFEGLVESLLRSSGAALGIGRYAEIRGLYQSEVFAQEDSDEARTVHLGVDLFAPAGTPVSAPLEGTVHSFSDNARPLDYGPTIILEHRIDGAPGSFFTLYGHLERRSIMGLEVGQVITAGEVFAWIGEPEVNGGWPAHLHFQITGDMLGKRGDFPGVARHSEIAVWKALCPNPARFVGLADKDLDANCGMSPVELARRRDLCLSPSLSLAFANPIKVVRGRGAYLFTEQGRKILDLVNNVAHVGHAHPRVVAAIAQQEAQLNTNTRYL
ncbi:MAG: aminotransferase class III-fold pyridoxal phosphate-dependent enzyme, partial [Gammaproteobacteria bacterium]|nr:aminotransferase class III-fold pyridoxal phosphate-dependent enzyme [Gammaproteobacteria bacterium]